MKAKKMSESVQTSKHNLTFSSTTLSFLQDRMIDFIQSMVDDSSWLVHPDETQSPCAAINEIRLAARELGLDYNYIVENTGSVQEREILAKRSEQTWAPCEGKVSNKFG